MTIEKMLETGGSDRGDEHPPAAMPRGCTRCSWIVILLLVTVQAWLASCGGATGEPGEGETLGLELMDVQGRYVVGAAALQGGGDVLQAFSKGLNVGTVAQRLRFVVLTAELAGTEAAAGALADLGDLIRREQHDPGEQALRTRSLLVHLYATGDASDEALARRVADLPADDQDALVAGLGWFGQLALAPAGIADTSARESLMRGSVRTALGMITAGVGLLGAGSLGFVGLLVLLVLACLGRLRDRLGAGRVAHGLLAETFAVWMIGFLLLQVIAAAVTAVLSIDEMVPLAGAFFLSLAALAWPVMRGVPWSVVRRDIGWHRGHGAWKEILLGPACWAMTLPILMLGILAMLLLMALDGMLGAGSSPFAPAVDPVHPIVLEVLEGGWGARLKILLVAVVAAPIVEETMFRGVLYRALRSGTSRLGLVASILASVLVSSFLFAALHPQGWLAIPALMALAIGMTLAREWRGSIVAPMVLHGVSNGLVMGFLFMLF